jgi:hypothetical protein
MAISIPSNYVGTRDNNLSPYLHAWIKQGTDCVVGVIGEGTSKELTPQWKSPFADSGLAARYSKFEGLLQVFSGMLSEAGAGAATTVSTLNSRLTWEGSETALALVLRLYALNDPKKEVMEALKTLEKMASPELSANQATATALQGRTPGAVTVNIGRLAIYTDCVIAGITMPLDKEKNKDGYLIRADVNIQLKPVEIINKSKIESIYG